MAEVACGRGVRPVCRAGKGVHDPASGGDSGKQAGTRPGEVCEAGGGLHSLRKERRLHGVRHPPTPSSPHGQPYTSDGPGDAGGGLDRGRMAVGVHRGSANGVPRAAGLKRSRAIRAARTRLDGKRSHDERDRPGKVRRREAKLLCGVRGQGAGCRGLLPRRRHIPGTTAEVGRPVPHAQVPAPPDVGGGRRLLCA